MTYDLSTKNGQIKAVEEHYYYFSASAQAFFRKHYNGAVLAKDLTQDSYIKAIKSIKRGSGPKKNIKSWISTLVLNEGIDLLRKEQRRKCINTQPKSLPSNAYDSGEEDIQTKRLYEKRLALVHEFASTLPPKQKQVIELVLKNNKNPEIAAILNTTPDRVKVNKGRGKRAIKAKVSTLDLS